MLVMSINFIMERINRFGMAISEALAAGLLVVAWKLPVFEERFGKEPNQNVKLVELG